MFKFLSESFDNFKKKISNTKNALVNNVVDTVSAEEEFSEIVLEDMEDLLISADLGVKYTSELVDRLRNQTKIKPSNVKDYLKDEFEKVLKNKWIEYSKYDYDFHKNLSYIDDGDITWIIRNEILATSTPID